ncbi:hypothetical protein OIU85_002143 [Salix viminalis]|uniref:4a-hydroxytetrahydrobiopterin dehydratase n=1 Tax=Salix viminalis TaxID=40686 RepID=A0A9Q0VNY2_SALVM|nr:hypothetical protein OIU85_002143 [Salix viminalis]
MATRFLPLTQFSFSKPQVPLATLSHILFGGHHGRFSTQVEKIRWNHVGESSNRNLIYRFRTFCAIRDLAAKKCVPCNSKDLQAMTEESATEYLLKLNRSWRVRNFTKGLELFQLVGNVAETEGHHPDLHLVGWNNVTIEIWTHAVGGLTENDFILAAKINGLDLHHLLRKKTAA